MFGTGWYRYKVRVRSLGGGLRGIFSQRVVGIGNALPEEVVEAGSFTPLRSVWTSSGIVEAWDAMN